MRSKSSYVKDSDASVTGLLHTMVFLFPFLVSRTMHPSQATIPQNPSLDSIPFVYSEYEVLHSTLFQAVIENAKTKYKK